MNYTTGIFRESPGLRWLVLDLNSFFASCEQQERPELRGRPVIVVPGMAETTCAIAASYEAKAFGIRTGTLVGEARRLCPGVIRVEARHKRYVEYHHRILEAIETCLPIDRVMSIDEVACRLDTVQRNPDAARALGLDIKRAIAARAGACLTSSIGIASNPFLAKLASNLKKPDGLTLLPPEDLPGTILHLDLREIPGIGRNMEARLAEGGIRDMAALWQASPETLRRLWGGIGGVKFHACLHGADLAAPAHARRGMSHQHVLAPVQRNRAHAVPVFRELLEKAAQRLRREGFYCRSLAVDVKWDRHGGHWGMERRFGETRETTKLLGMLNAMLRAMPEGRPLRVGVAVGGLVPQERHQPDLFAQPQGEDALSRALDRLNGKYGRATVCHGLHGAASSSKIAFQRVPDLAEF